jgi:hypothetical protein
MASRRKLVSFLCVLIGAQAWASVSSAHVNQPQEVINRPRTLPGAELELNAGVDLFHRSDMNSSQTDIRVPLGIGYGISNDFDVHLFYGVLLRPRVTGEQPVEVRLGYTFLRDRGLTAAARVMSGVDLGDRSVTPLRLGANVQYNFTPAFALFTPGEQLTATLSGGTKSIHLDLPVGVAWQATPQVYASLTTNLAHINVANDSNAFFPNDMIPVSLLAFYSPSNALDLGAHLDLDLKSTDRFVFGVLVRVFV